MRLEVSERFRRVGRASARPTGRIEPLRWVLLTLDPPYEIDHAHGVGCLLEGEAPAEPGVRLGRSLALQKTTHTVSAVALETHREDFTPSVGLANARPTLHERTLAQQAACPCTRDKYTLADTTGSDNGSLACVLAKHVPRWCFGRVVP